MITSDLARIAAHQCLMATLAALMHGRPYTHPIAANYGSLEARALGVVR